MVLPLSCKPDLPQTLSTKVLFLMPKAVWEESRAADAKQEYPHQDGGRDDDLGVPCPPGTTERALVNRIDWKVIPFLCIMYLLAFLDR
jgi:hypothetical protein